jgi:peptide chain release factor subunit 1
MISQFELEGLIEKLGKIRGRHTELVTVLIPAGANIYTIADQISAEQSTADNIKSKTVRKNVTNALDMISRELKKYRQTPENGMAIFCGNISEKEGQDDLQLWIIEPPKPLRTRMYRCDQVFVLEPLKEMAKTTEIYGLLVMDRREATIGLLEGKQIKVMRKMSSGVPGKIRAGGQSSARFERITDGLAKEFFKRVAVSMKEIFFDMKDLKGILIGGPIPTKEEFLEQGQLVTKLKDLVIGVKDIGNTDESGLEDLVVASQDTLAQQEIIKEKKILEKFFFTLGKTPYLAAYGETEVKKVLKLGAVGTLILSKKLDRNLIRELEEMAKNISADCELVSTETSEGEQFFNLSGIGAILRFRV